MLSQKDVKYIAQMARLKLDEAEEKKLVKELSSILEYVKKLEEVNTTGVEPTAQVTGLINVVQEDKIQETDKEKIEDILNNAPNQEEKMIKVKKIL